MTERNEGSCQATPPEFASADRTTPINPNSDTEPAEDARTCAGAKAEATPNVPFDPPGEVSLQEQDADLRRDETAPTNQEDAAALPVGAEQAPAPGEPPEGKNPKTLTTKEKAAKAVAKRKASKEAAENKPQGEGASRVEVKRAGAAKVTKGAKPRSASPPGNSAQKATREPDLIKEEIRAEQGKIEQNEGNTIVNLVTIGRRLVELQEASKDKRDWTEHVETLGYNSRTARRLQELGESRWSQNGTPGTEILGRLPVDPQKLVLLCRLSSEQLAEYIGREDLKKVDRKKMRQDVRAIRGEPEPERKPSRPKPGTLDKVVESFAKFVSNKVAALEKLDRDAIDMGEVQSKFRDAVDGAFGRLATTPEPATDDESAPRIRAAESGPRPDPRPRDVAVAAAPQT